MVNNQKICVIIVTYNGMQWLPNCLSSIPTVYSVVIVDNNSTDGTPNYIKENYPQFKLLQVSKNLGFGQANNKGISYALKEGAEAVFLLNQDAYLEPETINRLLDVQQNQPEYGLLSPIHTNKEKTHLDEKFSNYVAYKRNIHFYSDFVLENAIQEVYEVPFVNAAGWLISKKCLETVGGFDPIFFHYGEDNNYCQRVVFHGFKIGIVPNSFMVHDREERVKPKLDRHSELFLKNLEIKIKVEYADINSSNKKRLEYFYSKIKRNYYRQLLLLKLDNSIFYKKYMFLLNKIIPEIELSLKTNKGKGFHYIEHK